MRPTHFQLSHAQMLHNPTSKRTTNKIQLFSVLLCLVWRKNVSAR